MAGETANIDRKGFDRPILKFERPTPENGENAEYVVLETAGKNALDFHIAYYLGALSTEEPTAFFHIISKDSGFDPLIKYLKARKIFVRRSECIADIPYFKPSLPAAPDAQIAVVVADLQRRKAFRLTEVSFS